MFKISYDKKITMVQGDTGVIRMKIHNYELSQGDEVRFAIVNKANPSILLCQHSDKKIVLEKQVTAFEKDGSARIIIHPDDTEYLQPGKYLYEIQVKTKDGRIDTVVPLASFTLMDGSIQGEFGQTTPSKPELTPSEIELRFKRLENEIIPELGNRITNVEKEIIPELGNRITNVENEIDSINSSLDTKASKEHLDKTINILSNVYDSKYKYSLNELMGGADIKILDINSYFVSKLQCTLDNSLITLNAHQGLKPNYNIGIDGKSLKDPFVYKENGIYYMYVTYFSKPTADDSNIALFKSSNGIDFEFTKIVVDRNNCWGASGGTIWAPTVVKVNDKYYMFVSSGLSGYKSGYLISDNLETGWTWVDVCRNSNGETLDIIDTNFNYINGEFYMVGVKPSPSAIVLYKGDLINNIWYEVKTLVVPMEEWEGIITEAPQIIEYENKFILLYGGNDSVNKQRIGIVISDRIDGEYKRAGLLGQLLLDFPLSKEGTIAHPHIMYENGEFTLYTCVGLSYDNNTNMKIMIYKGKEILKLNPTKVEKTLIQGKNYLYINNSGLLINAGDMPYYKTDKSINIDMCNRIGFVYLGDINFENNGFVVYPYREYVPVAIFNAKKEWTTTISDTKNSGDIWGYIGGCFPAIQRKKGKLVGKIIVGCNAKDNENIYVRLVVNNKPLEETILTFNDSWFVDKESKWIELYDNQWGTLGVTLEITGATGEYVMGGATTIVLAIEK